MRNIFVLVLACVVGLMSRTVRGDGEQVEAVSVSPLLVLLAATDEVSIKIERQLVAELRLTLDGVQVEQIAIERGDFLSVPLPEQLKVVEPLIRRFMARAAVWVVTGGRSGHLIQFVVSDRGNSTVRTVDAGSPEELALAVRELLDSAYLFNKKKTTDDTDVRRHLFALASTWSISGGMVGHSGASVAGGAGLQARFMLNEGVRLGVQIAGKLGPRVSSVDGLGLGWRTEYGVFAGYLFKIGEFGLGPYGELTAHRNTFASVFEKGEYEKSNWWSFRGALGMELSLRLSEKLAIFIDWTFGGIAIPYRFKRSSNDSTVLATPAMDYAFSLGLATSLL